MLIIDAPEPDPDHPTDTDPTPTGTATAAPPDGVAVAETPRERARRVAARAERAALTAVQAAHREALIDLHRTETKATALITVFATALAAALVLARTVHTGPAALLADTAALPLLAALAALLFVLTDRSRGPLAGVRRWALFRGDTDALTADLDRPVRHQITAHAEHLADLSAAALARARCLSAAIWLLLAGLALLTLAALL